MNQEEFLSEMRTVLPVIREFVNHSNQLLSGMQQACRSDVSFYNIETCQALIDDSKSFAEILKRLQKAQKARASSRMKDIKCK